MHFYHLRNAVRLFDLIRLHEHIFLQGKKHIKSSSQNSKQVNTCNDPARL